MTTTTSLAREFAAKYAKNVVPANLKAIRQSKHVNLAVMGAAIACTYWHQASYLAPMPGFSLGHAGPVDLSLGYLAPLVWDIAMLANANTLATPAIAKSAKTRATVMMIGVGAVSAAVNVLADGSVWARIVFALLVVIAVGQKWAGAAIKPDFAALETMETTAVADASPTAVEGRKCPDGCTCGKHAPNPVAKAKPRTRKAPIRKPRATKLNNPVASVTALPDNAPISPAPGGRMTDSGLWLATR